jgi:hypothetical protein
MANKLQERAQKSKLNIERAPAEKVVQITRTAYSRVRTFRLDDASWHNLTSLLEKLNLQSQRKISASRLVKALIQLGVESKTEEIFQALREVGV